MMSTQTFSVGSNPEIQITNVGGDLSIRGWERTDLEARSDDSPRVEQDGDAVTLSCGGDLSVSLPRSATVAISYVGGDLKVENLDGAVELSFVGGDVFLQNISGEVSIAGVIGGETRTENVAKVSMSAQGGGIGVDVSAKVQRKVDEAMRKADRKLRNAEHKLRQAHSAHLDFRMRDVEQVMRRDGQSVSPRWNASSNTSDAEESSHPISDEERMAILKMLQEKKITSEEADKLLAALEGGE
jgi:SHOCT-like domain